MRLSVRRFADRVRPPLADAVLALMFVVVGQVDVWSPWGDEFPRGGFDGPSGLNAVLVLLYTPVASTTDTAKHCSAAKESCEGTRASG